MNESHQLDRSVGKAILVCAKNIDAPCESDDALMQRVAQGDSAAFARLVALHMPRIVSVAWRMTGSRSDADDVAQEAFARVWVNAPKWRPTAQGGASLGTWLYRVVMNLCIDRKRRVRPESIDNVPEPEDERPDAACRIAERQMAERVREAIAALPERQRAVLVLCHYEGMSNIAAAASMAVSVGAVESLLIRARRTLKDRLAKTYAELGEG
jgi:RNA polymerase sigma-70 factor (ECF subfamily)